MNKQQYAELVRETRKNGEILESNPEAFGLHVTMTALEHPDLPVSAAHFAHDVRLFNLKKRLRTFQG